MTLRPAAATWSDGRAFAGLLNLASEGLYRIALGRRAEDIIAEAFAHPGHDLSYETVTFAERGGDIVGMASGYTAEAHRKASLQPLQAAAGWRRHRMAAFSRFARRLVQFMGTIHEGDYYLHALAVDPATRGVTGLMLFASEEDRARAAGAARLALDVAAKNADTRRLYERLGLVAEAESPKWFGLPNSNVIRMAKQL